MKFNFKKTFCILISLLMITAVLCGCKTDEDSSVGTMTKEGISDSIIKQDDFSRNEFDGYITINGMKYPNNNNGAGIQTQLYKYYTSLKDIYNDVENIIVAEVIESETPETSDTAPIDYTPSKVKVIESLKGNLKKDNIVKVFETGKHLENGKDESISGVPLLNSGMKVILFLKEGEKNEYWSISGPYGKFFFDSNDLIHHSVELAYDAEFMAIKQYNTKAMNDNATFKAKVNDVRSVNIKPGVTLDMFKNELETYK